MLAGPDMSASVRLRRVVNKAALIAQWRFNHRLAFKGAHTFVDRSRSEEALVLLLAGYKPYLWEYTLERLDRAVDGHDADVCIVSAGLRQPALERFAAERGWSYLSTAANQMARALNIAIDRHPSANWIYKLDEDIFVDRHFIGGLRSGYERITHEATYRVGFVAPVINVNGFSYTTFLQRLGLEEAYRDAFGPLLRAPKGQAAQSDGKAARWIWERTLPFEQTAEVFASTPFRYSVVPHRFSIGAILFERDLWDTVSGFRAHLVPGELGVDERYLCEECVTRGRVMAVVHNVLAGHFSFGPQDLEMRAMLAEAPDRFRVPAAVC